MSDWRSECRSDAPENLRASLRDRAATRPDGFRDPSSCNGRRVDEAPRPDRGHSAVCRPRPRRLEGDPKTSRAPRQVIGNHRTWEGRVAEEDSPKVPVAELARKTFKIAPPLAFPNGRRQALGRSHGGGCNQSKQCGDDTVHVRLLPALVVMRGYCTRIAKDHKAGKNCKDCSHFCVTPVVCSR